MANSKKRKHPFLYITVSLALVAAVVIGVTAAARGGTHVDPSKVATVERTDLAKSVVATGKIEPITKIAVKSKASGIVKKLLVDAGEHVTQGQLLAELDRDEIQAQVNQARAQLQAAEANVAAARADLERARVDAEGVDVPTLKRAYERAQQMAKEGVVAPQALDDAQRNYLLAVNKTDSARAQVTSSQAKIRQGEAQVAQMRATLDQLEQQLGYTYITSPIEGTVLSRDVEVGDAVSSILVLGSTATQIMTLGDTHEVYVKGKVDESDISKVYLGQPASIKVESFKDRSFAGRVTKISPMGLEKDNVTTFEVRVSISNPGGELKAEMTANAEILLELHHNVLVVPEAALIYDKDKNAFVELPDPNAHDGKKKVPVTVGISNGAKTEVLGGLKQDQKIVLQ
ncbi:MAG: efflux RND transporter periplasmic adaptor subunit [Acidobacteria bacterium]|nr:efflux RND transporter periplasmic adaptor subunit [Acidobacteriota bacterium]